MYQKHVCMIMIFLIRISLFLGALGSHLCKKSQKQYHLYMLVIKAGDGLFSFTPVKATVVQTVILYCTVTPADNRQIHFFGRVSKNPENPGCSYLLPPCPLFTHA